MSKILIRYAEIGLKGKNLSSFENQLVANIAQSLEIGKSDIVKLRKQFLLTIADSLINQSVAKLKHVFGIAWFAVVVEAKTDLADLKKAVVSLTREQIGAKDTFAIKAHRNDKMVSFTSQDANRELGEAVRVQTKAKVDLSHPDKTIYLDIGKKQTFIYSQKISGPGGLPVGSSGKVLSLISGGFDSISASYLLAKRGAQVDFAHFHVFADHTHVLKTKIKTIVDDLKKTTFSQKLFLLSYLPFQMETIDLPGNLAAHELVVFRRLMVRVACELAKKHGYEALVLGDSLGQVASQTLSNIVAVDEIADVPIFRPLIGMDKKDIIDLVRELNLEKEAISPYKDCCSIISKSPATRAHPEKVSTIEKKIKIDKVAGEIANKAAIINL
jgi:thiamine biosynthesis protein ThiI